MELKEPVTVNIWGHEAKIMSISLRTKLETWYKDDSLLVLFHLTKFAYGISGFGISLPVKDYSKEDFLDAVVAEGEAELQSIAARHHEKIEEQKQEEERKKELDTIVQNIVSRLAEV